jgi:hypothetical protein
MRERAGILPDSPGPTRPRNVHYYMRSSYRKSRHSVHCRHGINVPRPCLVILDSLAPLSDTVLNEGRAWSRDKYLRYRTSTHDVLRTTSDVLSTIPAMPSNSIEPMSKVEHAAESWAGVETGANVTSDDGLRMSRPLTGWQSGRISESGMCWRSEGLVERWEHVTKRQKVDVVMTSERKKESRRAAAGRYGRASRLICGCC